MRRHYEVEEGADHADAGRDPLGQWPARSQDDEMGPDPDRLGNPISSHPAPPPLAYFYIILWQRGGLLRQIQRRLIWRRNIILQSAFSFDA